MIPLKRKSLWSIKVWVLGKTFIYERWAFSEQQARRYACLSAKANLGLSDRAYVEIISTRLLREGTQAKASQGLLY